MNFVRWIFSQGSTRIRHSVDETGHQIHIEGLRVLVREDADGWIAQGLEIDYAASGISAEDVVERFAKGLAHTLHCHLKTFGTFERVLKSAPEKYWKPFLLGSYQRTACRALEEFKRPDLLPGYLRHLQLYEQPADTI